MRIWLGLTYSATKHLITSVLCEFTIDSEASVRASLQSDSLWIFRREGCLPCVGKTRVWRWPNVRRTDLLETATCLPEEQLLTSIEVGVTLGELYTATQKPEEDIRQVEP